MKNSEVIVMFRFNKQYSKEKEEDDVLLTQRLSDQNSLSQTEGTFLKKLQVQKNPWTNKKKIKPQQNQTQNNNGICLRKNK